MGTGNAGTIRATQTSLLARDVKRTIVLGANCAVMGWEDARVAYVVLLMLLIRSEGEKEYVHIHNAIKHVFTFS